MNQLPADEIVLVFGARTLNLRGHLRAACRLVRLHQGFPGLLTKVAQADTATLHTIILETATDREAALDALAEAAKRPLSEFITAARGPILAVCEALMPGPSTSDHTPSTKALSWEDAYRQLYGIATGWLGWTPHQAWESTAQEITDAFTGHVAKLTAIHGLPDSEENDRQRQENIAQGLDPDLDRSGLHSLSGSGGVR